MGFLGTLKGLPILVLVAVVLLFVANLFNLIAFSTTAWGESYSYILNTVIINPGATYTNYGLWRVCTGTQAGYILNSPGNCADSYVGTALGYLAAVQALSCIGLVGLILSLVLVLAYLCGKQEDDFLLIAAILCIVTGILYLIGVVLYGVEFNKIPALLGIISSVGVYKLGWSFALAVIACILEIVSGVLLIVGRKKVGTSPA